MLPKGYQGVVYVLTTVLSWNPTVVRQRGLMAPKSWEDLTEPQWKGQLSIDPYAVNWYDSLIIAMGARQSAGLAQGTRGELAALRAEPPRTATRRPRSRGRRPRSWTSPMSRHFLPR
ncbi:ABC transporter substrate-binding protein [Amycolatopsis sp. DSM 110486]|uniref:ABC transporter substrate-binding protein n=1 Tax=Amycolatopsis sp. DSM 110486 TaxID=2865832 RepID=UPI001C694720|nr:ABC transporter substrate-binding protein [Amycolatopsis sp. DSM 110486]QYN18980.1 ABC transporter substrate-binding protein [Amycolatopsis sp. DSM 110486]